MIIFFVVTLGTLTLAHHFQEPVMERFALQGGSPGDAPPWYFITRDFAEGICAFGALLLSLVIAGVTWRWWPSYSSMIVWMSIIWHGGALIQSWIIYQSCPGILDGQRVTERWPTFDSYISDSGIWASKISVLIFAVLLSFALRPLSRLGRSGDNSLAT